MNLTELLGIDHPIIVAPMFLISNTKMVIAACENGATAAFPALNYRTDEELRDAISEIRSKTDKPFGVNLIVNKSNTKYKKQLNTLIDMRVDYIITSLGNPKEVINRCKPLGIKVFCDVVDLKYAKKVESLGADAIIAVNNKAGGHCGPLSKEELITSIMNECAIPIISAGGIGTAEGLQEVLELGAAGASIGTVFLACEEADISEGYRDAIIQYGAKDIVLSTKLSGSHLTVINTPYVQKTGTKPNLLERLLKNRFLKKWVKMIIYLRGMSKIKNAALGHTYKTVWCAGPSIEHIKEIRPLKNILKSLVV